MNEKLFVGRSFATVGTLAQGYRAGELLPSEVIRGVIEAIEDTRSTINAFVSIDPVAALEAARESDARWTSNQALGPLDGIPVSPKDSMMVRKQATRAGSITASDALEAEDAPYIARLRTAGAVIVGRTATPEYCWTGATKSPLNGITRNPWDPKRNVGGSSGGAGAAVGAGIVPVALGTDAGGSIRTPASLCGVVGFKPSFGVVPMHEREGYSTFNSPGPLTLTVSDARLVFGIMLGQTAPTSTNGQAMKPLAGLRTAVTADMGYARHSTPAVVSAVQSAATLLSSLGASVTVDHPAIEWPIDTYNTIGWAEQSVNLSAIVDEYRSAMDPGLVEIVEVGRKITTAEYINAQKARWRIGRRMREFFERFDLLVTPTLPVTAFDAQALSPDSDSVTAMNDWLPFSSIFNMTGQPAVTLPCGFDESGLPIGIQLIGRPNEDWALLDTAEALDAEGGWTTEMLRRATGKTSLPVV